MKRKKFLNLIIVLIFVFSSMTVINVQANNETLQNKTIENGTYEILSVINNGMSFDITDGANLNGTKIQMWQNIHANQQRFILEYDTSDGYYKIKSRQTDKYLTVESINPDWGSSITQEDSKSDDTQKWTLKKQTSGAYSILSKCGGLAIDIPDWNCSNGVKLQLWGLNDESTAQQFVFSNQKNSLKNVVEGNYEILSVINNGISFDITNGSNENGAKIQLWQNVNADQQVFTLEYNELDGYYKIKSKKTGKYLTVESTNPAWGSNIIQQDEKNDDTQKWTLKEQSSGAYSILSKCGGLAIDIPDWNCSNGVKLQLWGQSSSTSQQFILRKEEKGTKNIEEGTYEIASAINNISFDITNGSKANGAKIQLWQYTGSSQQKFEIIYISEGYYKIKSKRTGKYLAVESTNPSWGSNITQQDEKNDNTQLWMFVKRNNGGYSIISKCGGLAIDIPDWKSNNGVKLQLWGINESSSAQQFIFISKPEQTGKQTISNGDYRILTSMNTAQSFDIDGGSKEDGAKVQIWCDINSLQQKFEIKYAENGYYKIISKNSGKILTLENEYPMYGTQIIQKEDKNLDTQLWIIKEMDSGLYSIVSKLENLALSVNNENDGTRLTLREQDNSQNIKFVIVDEQIEEKADTSLVDGYYYITLPSNKVIDINGASFYDGANAQIWDRGAVQQQKFHVTRVPNTNYYKMVAVHSAKTIQVQNSDIYVGTNVNQGTDNGKDNQYWYLIDCGDGYYNIVSKSNNLYLQTVDRTQNASNIQVGYNNRSDNIRFRFDPWYVVEFGPFEIETKLDSNRVLDIDGGSYNDGANVQIWQPVNTNQERFTFTPISTSEFIIKNVKSNKALTVNDNNNVVQQKYAGIDSQIWIVREAGENYYNIISKKNGYLLDIQDMNTANGSNVQVWFDNGNDAQKFRLVSGYRKFFEQGTYGTSGKRQSNQGGYDLTYYKIGQGSKHLFITFSIHGFEDSYWKDGSELTYMANQFKDYLYNNITEDLVNKWTIYIFPNLNPDGQYDGWTNDGPGRTTVYSYAPNHQGIDMNRGCSVGFQRLTSARNYTGTEAFQAPEAAQLRDFILAHQGSSNVLIDVHGWLNETIGDNGIGSYYRSEFGISKHIGSYGSGYLINWARSLNNTRSMLLELPEVSNHNQVLSSDYSGKFTRATMRLLNDL